MYGRQRRHSLCVLLLLGLGVAGCDATSAPRGVITTRSQVVLTEPPVVFDTSGPSSSPAWRFTGQDTVVSFVAANSEATGSIDLQDQARTMVVLPWYDNGVITHFLVGCIDASERWSLFRFHDATGDTIPDASTRVLLLDTGSSSAYVTYLARAPGSGTVYLLDRRCQDVLVATDTDSDGFPDHLDATPFAESAAHPALLRAHMLLAVDAWTIDAPERIRLSPDDRGAFARFQGDVLRLGDVNHDGRADTSSMWNLDPSPSMYGQPYEGQVGVKVAGGQGAIAELWAVSELDNSPIALLGQVALGSGPWTALALGTPLTADAVVRLNYSDRREDGRILRVGKDTPQLCGVSTHTLRRTGDTVEVQGVNLHGNVVARLRTGAQFDDVHVLAVIVHDSESATLTIPELPASAVGTALLELEDPSNPGVGAGTVSVCEDEAE